MILSRGLRLVIACLILKRLINISLDKSISFPSGIVAKVNFGCSLLFVNNLNNILRVSILISVPDIVTRAGSLQRGCIRDETGSTTDRAKSIVSILD